MSFHAQRFDRAAATYGLHAQVQERMAEILLGLLPWDGNAVASPGATAPPGPEGGRSPANAAILEMGCGTGNFTRRLRQRFPGARLLATDAAPRMLASARSNLSVTGGIDWDLFDASGNGATADPARAWPRFGLAASNALVQWFPDLRPHLGLVAGLLASRAVYLVSGFSRDNFPELNAILKEPPFAYPDYPGHTETEIRAAAASCGFRVEAYREEEMAVILPSARAFLDSIRGLGSARRPEADRPLTRSRLRLLLATYQERYPSGEGVRVTWKPWLARLRRLA